MVFFFLVIQRGVCAITELQCSVCDLEFLLALIFSFFDAFLVDRKRAEYGIDHKIHLAAREKEWCGRFLKTVRTDKHQRRIMQQ
jgi:hypothetical protein